MSTSCCSTSPFNTPAAGSVLVVPPGSVVVSTPTLGCGGEVLDAVGSVTGGTGASAPSGATFFYPQVSGAFTAPAIGGSGSFYSANAVQWAVVGALAWISPVGHVQITGISGTLVSFTNLSIGAGNTVAAGSTILVSAPPAPSSAGIPADSARLTKLRGYDDLNERLLPGTSGQILRHDGVGWKSFNGKVWYPLSESIDITPSGFAPVPTNSALTVNIDLDLPNLPSPLPAEFFADITLVLTKTAVNATTVERSGRILVGGTYGTTGCIYAASATIRCTDSTPQLVLNKTNGATGISLLVFVNGYHI